MDCQDLKSQQLDVLVAKLRGALHFLTALEKRAEERQFPPDDLLRKATRRAIPPLQDLAALLEALKKGRMPFRDYVGNTSKRRYEVEQRQRRLSERELNRQHREQRG